MIVRLKPGSIPRILSTISSRAGKDYLTSNTETDLLQKKYLCEIMNTDCSTILTRKFKKDTLDLRKTLLFCNYRETSHSKNNI